MCRNTINLLYNPGHVTRWCLEVVLVVFASDVTPQKSMSELAWEKDYKPLPLPSQNTILSGIVIQRALQKKMEFYQRKHFIRDGEIV